MREVNAIEIVDEKVKIDYDENKRGEGETKFIAGVLD